MSGKAVQPTASSRFFMENFGRFDFIKPRAISVSLKALHLDICTGDKNIVKVTGTQIVRPTQLI
jgi:hypothetical protein